MTSENPYERVGLQDATSADFRLCLPSGSAGSARHGIYQSDEFLVELGLEDFLSRWTRKSRVRAAIHLVRPEGIGRTFKVLIQHEGIEKPTLDGLAFKPFFGSALTLHHAA